MYGARPLRRYLEKYVVTELSRLILSNQLQEHCTVHVDAKDDNLTFMIEDRSAEAAAEADGAKKKKVSGAR